MLIQFFKLLQKFVLVPPKLKSLDLLREGSLGAAMLNPQGEEENLGLCTVTVRAGGTLFVPSGWIRASSTVQNAILVHGAFLHTFGVKSHVAIVKYEEEQNVSTQAAVLSIL